MRTDKRFDKSSGAIWTAAGIAERRGQEPEVILPHAPSISLDVKFRALKDRIRITPERWVSG